MIKKISKLKDFGLFQNYTNDNSLDDFNRYNLFYGLNGSGKSTLVNLFRWIETKQAVCFPESEWNVITDNNNIIDQNNVGKNTLNIKVFNKDFVEKNVFTRNGVKGILYLSEGTGNEINKLDANNDLLKLKEENLNLIEIEMNGNNEDKKSKGLLFLNDSFLSNTAKKIKTNFKVIEIEDNRLLNYDKTKLAAFIESNKEKILAKKNTLSTSEIEKLTKSIKPQEKDYINTENIKKFESTLFKKIYERVIDLQMTHITTKTIDRLKENPKIADWVYKGLREIHSEKSSVCEFCGQPLDKHIIDKLNRHFSEEFEKLKIALTNGIEWIEENEIKTDFPQSSLLYDEYKIEYEKAVKEYEKIAFSLNSILGEWSTILEEKQENPFEIEVKTISEVSFNEINEYDNAFSNIINVINEHNNKHKSLGDEVKSAKQKLELHYVSEEVLTYDYINKKTKEKEIIVQQEILHKEIKELKENIISLKKELSNEVLAEKEFNEMLYKFLGRNDLRIETRLEGGYWIKRNNETKADNLSEGEKTAIGLVYFITKLKEDRNKVEDSIIVIDDPVSSFDSNHLFHANFYIKNECENAKQLFVFTHNFRFFSLQKEWISSKKYTDPVSNNKKTDAFKLYLIKSFIDNDIRQGKIYNADIILTHFDSEYHMLFSEVKNFIDNPKNDYISTHTISNICRQLLESFLSFKYGRKKLEKCFDEIKGFEDLPKVRKFVNHYSHKIDNGESFKGFNDNIIGEADKIVPLVLDLIKYVDKQHYDSMIARLTEA